ncbi:cytochrome c biogenesis protein ResB [Pseudonocardia oroxyli]|uniref:Cytochrome c biogenesis protein n=1 Tax=Pseudonocardia oroxyli TaxID=366584 RepID=A0A1G7G0C6_PSEOR|nr:cytochrome c biogenesis protein ResB [Pseudonocardia oroxyli]SDE81614.1 cytochrome c biogenesis protein [Pseudonocardia oroxyli]
MSTTIPAPPAAAPPPPHRTRAVLAFARNAWRGLTSMRTALVLLFLLALASLPGALLPQRSLNAQLVDQYFADYPQLAPLLDKVGAFEVFATPWFAAIYLLLMISLVGCLTPRTVEYWRAMRQRPVATPRNLARMPHHAVDVVEGTPDQVLDRMDAQLKGWRRVRSADTISAEKGYLRETGNLVFHVSIVGLLIAMAVGKLFGYEGQVIVLANGSQFCNTSILGYDSFRPGLQVDGTELAPFCIQVNSFQADYLSNGQPEQYRAQLGYQTAAQVESGDAADWQDYELAVNHPLRIDGERVYLLNHGYAPRFTVTWPDGTQRTGEIQWQPVDLRTYLSQGATKFERPGIADPAERQRSSIAVTGLFAPTSSGGQVVTSTFPDLLAPEAAVDVMRGDLGLDDGRGQSIFSVDQSKVDSGELTRVARENMVPGQSITLDDGTQIRFDDVTQWVALQISHDPGQEAVLVFALLMLGGLALSLSIKRRRFWVRVTPEGEGRSRVELGGLARTDRAGYGEEFDRLRTTLTDLLEPTGSGAR